MTTLEHGNMMLVAAAAAALLHHAHTLAAAGTSLEDMNGSLGRYAQDLECWRAGACARLRACCAEPPSRSVH